MEATTAAVNTHTHTQTHHSVKRFAHRNANREKQECAMGVVARYLHWKQCRFFFFLYVWNKEQKAVCRDFSCFFLFFFFLLKTALVSEWFTALVWNNKQCYVSQYLLPLARKTTMEDRLEWTICLILSWSLSLFCIIIITLMRQWCQNEQTS